MREWDRGYMSGVAWALTVLCRSFGDYSGAEMLFRESGLKMSEFRAAGVEEYDRKILRQISPTRRDYYSRSGNARSEGTPE